MPGAVPGLRDLKAARISSSDGMLPLWGPGSGPKGLGGPSGCLDRRVSTTDFGHESLVWRTYGPVPFLTFVPLPFLTWRPLRALILRGLRQRGCSSPSSTSVRVGVRGRRSVGIQGAKPKQWGVQGGSRRSGEFKE